MRPYLLAAFSLWAVVGLCGVSAAQSAPAADLIISHAKVWTVDPVNPTAQTVAVLRERIVAVGSDADIARWRGPQTRVLDAGGRLLLPGFNDAHVHFVSGGAQLDNVQLNDATSSVEFARRIGERAKVTPQWQLDPGRRLGRNQMDACTAANSRAYRSGDWRYAGVRKPL